MLTGDQLELLDKLRFSEKATDRKQALNDLKRQEVEGRFEPDDLLSLLENTDFVFITYAIGAIGRLRIEKGISRLQKLYEKSNDPLVLCCLLDTFMEFESSAFVDCVLTKLNYLTDRVEKDKAGNRAFLLEQIIAPSLKYLQVSGVKKIEGTIQRFLMDSNPTIRWHALMTFDKLNLLISDDELKKINQTDSYALVREQASVMLEKRKRNK